MLRRTLAAAPFTAAVVLVLACASPTLPLPPPEPPTMLQGADPDHIELVAGCGSAEASALIIVVNTNSTVPSSDAVTGIFADSVCGKWDLPNVYAHNGDVLNLTQQFGDAVSSVLTLQVRVP